MKFKGVNIVYDNTPKTEVTMTGFEYRRITEALNKFEKDVEESTFLGVPIMDLNKYQLEKLVCFQNAKINRLQSHFG
jgi:hypothetical protein